MMKKTLFILIAIFLLSVSLFSTTETDRIWKIKTKGKTARVRFIYKNLLIATAGEYLEFGSPNHLIYCINKLNGQVQWTKDVGKNNIISDFRINRKRKILYVKLANERVIFLDFNGKVIRGDANWIPKENVLNKNIKYAKAASYNGSRRKNTGPGIHVIHKKTKKILWQIKFKPKKNFKYPYRADFNFFVEGMRLFIGHYTGHISSYYINLNR